MWIVVANGASYITRRCSNLSPAFLASLRCHNLTYLSPKPSNSLSRTHLKIPVPTRQLVTRTNLPWGKPPSSEASSSCHTEDAPSLSQYAPPIHSDTRAQYSSEDLAAELIQAPA
jgi:hypothetical protein